MDATASAFNISKLSLNDYLHDENIKKHIV